MFAEPAAELIFVVNWTLNNWNKPAKIGIINATTMVTIPALNIVLGDILRFNPKKLLNCSIFDATALSDTLRISCNLMPLCNFILLFPRV